MNMPSIHNLLPTCLLLLLCTLAQPVFAQAENGARAIYLGDIITLQLTGSNLSLEQLQESFSPFEVLDFQVRASESGTYLLVLRATAIGEFNILLGSQTIVIKVRSTLADFPEQELFAGETWIAKAGFPYQRLLIALIAVAVAFFGLATVALLQQRRQKRDGIQSPYQRFLQHANALAIDTDDYFVALTFYFKEYLENLCRIRIVGKTATEIIAELQGAPVLTPLLPDIQSWLTECNRFKFAGYPVSNAEKQQHCAELLKLAALIETPQKDVA